MNVNNTESLVAEAATESSEDLMEKYLENGELTDEIKQGLRKRCIDTRSFLLYVAQLLKIKVCRLY